MNNKPTLLPFDCIKYINPVWYFNLNQQSYYKQIELLNPHVKNFYKLDLRYKSQISRSADASYQLICQGWTDYPNQDNALLLTNNIPIVDQYLFIRKYFHPLWSWYVLIRRLLTFKNPINEILGFIKTINIKREPFDVNPNTQLEFNLFKSSLIESRPKVAVIIPTLNRYTWLKDVLIDLENQKYNNFEVIIVDQSEPFNQDFYSGFNLKINLIYQKEKALWLARNRAIESTNAEYLLFFDDDSRVDPNWIENHLKAIDFFKADISSGVSISIVGAKVPKNYSYFRLGDQIDTGNAMIRRQVFQKIGLFDRQFEKQRNGDGEFGCRAHSSGFLNISNPSAQRLHLKVGEGGLRQMGHWDSFRPKNIFSPRPIPSVLYFYRKHFGDYAAMNALFIQAIPSLLPYRFKGRLYYFPILILTLPIIIPFVIIQTKRSWERATKMIAEGSKIENIK